MVVSACLLIAAQVPSVLGQEQADRPAAQRRSEGEIAAERLVERAKELLAMREYDRGVRMLENVFEQYPKSRVRFKARLELGKHLVEVQKYNEAVGYLRAMNALSRPDQILAGEDKDWYLEAQYLMGVAYFHMRQYGSAFTVLRAITRDYPNTAWANQSYYYIGMCHFAQQNWNRAIEALNMVGTFIDPDSPATQFVEAGRRLYVKVSDADIPILYQTGGSITLELETQGGDREQIPCVQLNTGDGLAMASIRTEPGVAVTNDNILQVLGGDLVTVKYHDDNTSEGKSRVLRQVDVRVVSTASIEFTLGTFESKAVAAFLGQPVFILLVDLDRDISPNADRATVRVVSRYKVEAEEAVSRAVDVTKLFLDDEFKEYEIRDEVTVTLTELGDPPVHSGRFGGKVDIEPWQDGTPGDKPNSVLLCALNDEIVVYYEDDLHIQGDVRREISAALTVVGEIDGRPMVTQSVVFDPVIRARKQLVEAMAYLELTRIFKSMGLMQNALEKSQEGLDRAQEVILIKGPISRNLKEEAFKIKWELLIEAGDYNQAVATCRLFSALYPDSPFADEALLKIGTSSLEEGDFAGAMHVFRSVIQLPNSAVRAEAQYRIAQALEMQSEGAARKGRGVVNKSAAMQSYKLCADKYPDSEFAGLSLGKLVDYYLESRDYAQADYLLEQVFQDYPDAAFLDSMLLKWVITAYRMGNFEKAREKANKLLFEYPSSPFAAQAKNVLPQLERK